MGIKSIKRALYAVLFLTVCLAGVFRCGGREALAASTKSGVSYPSKVRVDVGKRGYINLSRKHTPGEVDEWEEYRVLKVATSGKGLKAYKDTEAWQGVNNSYVHVYGEKRAPIR